MRPALTFVELTLIIAAISAPRHMMNPIRPPALITHTAQLQALLARLRDHDSVAVDTESDSLYAYREKVCLIQLSIPGADFLIDPLAALDLQPLASLLADEAVQKVFHAAEYDVMCLRRDFGFAFRNLFDTMWAARILGWKRVGLGDILQEQFGVTLDKKWQRHNWGRRPIEPAALSYAQRDTHHLLRLRDVQLRELRQIDRLAEAREVFSDLTRAKYNGHEFTPDDMWSLKGVWDLGGRAQAILRQLVILRDREARRQNRPAFKVIGDRTLLQIAERAPRTLEEMDGIEGMTSGQQQRYGAALLEAVARGRKDAIPAPPHRAQIDPEVSARYEALRAWRKQAAAQRGVEPDVIVSNAVLMEIAQRRPRAIEQLPALPWFGEWRRTAYGPALLQVIANP
jgi:ribonuclease D